MEIHITLVANMNMQLNPSMVCFAENVRENVHTRVIYVSIC